MERAPDFRRILVGKPRRLCHEQSVLSSWSQSDGAPARGFQADWYGKTNLRQIRMGESRRLCHEKSVCERFCHEKSICAGS